MDEAEWLNSNQSLALLRHVAATASERKLRLLACAGCRRVWHVLTDQRSRHAVEVSERHADDLASKQELQEASASAARVAEAAARERIPGWNAARTAAAATGQAMAAAERVLQAAGDAELVREVFGNPFRPVTPDPSWRTPAVTALAQAIYEERCFEDVPILADALEEAGCTNEDILSHCRSEGPHVRGCWVVDLLLGKG